jgi:hypothetical protein
VAINAYPLQWPEGWPRKESYQRKRAAFSRGERVMGSSGNTYTRKRDLTVTDGVERVMRELMRMGVDRQDIVISTNVRTRLDGLPRSGERKPDDPGAAVYWQKGEHNRVMAIDRYDEVADNLAAIALTLEALRSIDRHGGGQILERAFTGFTALPPPRRRKSWRDVFGFDAHATVHLPDIESRYRRMAMERHPDRLGGSETAMMELNLAREEALRAVGAPR